MQDFYYGVLLYKSMELAQLEIDSKASESFHKLIYMRKLSVSMDDSSFYRCPVWSRENEVLPSILY